MFAHLTVLALMALNSVHASSPMPTIAKAHRAHLSMTEAQTDSAEIRKTIESFIQATVKFDVAALKKLTHPDFVEISPLGEVDPREKFLGFYDVPEEKRQSPVSGFEIQDLQTRFLRKDVVLAHYKQAMTIGPAEAGRRFQIQVTTVLSSESGNWVLCSNTFTPIQKKPASTVK